MGKKQALISQIYSSHEPCKGGTFSKPRAQALG